MRSPGMLGGMLGGGGKGKLAQALAERMGDAGDPARRAWARRARQASAAGLPGAGASGAGAGPRRRAVPRAGRARRRRKVAG